MLPSTTDKTQWKGAITCGDGLKCFVRDAQYGQCLQTVSNTGEPAASATIGIDPSHGGGLDKDPKHVATAADGTGNEDQDSKDNEDSNGDTPTVKDGVIESGAASLVAPSAMVGLAVLAMVFL